MAVGGLLALATGCPPAATTEPPKGTTTPPPHATTPPGSTDHATPGSTDHATPKTETMSGKVTKAEKDKVMFKDEANKEQTADVGADTKVTIDGAAGKAEDIKDGSTVTVTKKGDTVTSIEAKKPTAAPPPPPPPAEAMTMSGKVTKAEKDKVMFKDDAGKEQTAAVGADTKVTIDGKEDKAENIKDGMTVTVTKKGDAITKIEAKK
jgi:antitoxin (DNA-binding transcriptional repressor) of toxin-antitoxin stability system